MFDSIEKSSVDAISQAVWDINDDLLVTLINGIKQQNDVVKIMIKDGENETIREVTKRDFSSEPILTKSFHLSYSGQEESIGTLEVTATKVNANKRLTRKLWTFFLSQMIKVLVVSILMLWIFHNVIIKHLRAISKYLRDYDIKRIKTMPESEFKLKRKIGYNDEFSVLCKSINKMVVLSIENFEIQEKLVRTKEKQKKNLESKVMARTRELHDRNKDIEAILDHVKHGIITTSDGVSIDSQYSEFTEEIFEQKELSGMKIAESILARSDLNEDVKSRLISAIQIIVGENTFMYDVNRNHLVKELVLKTKSGDKQLELEWTPIVDDDHTRKLMLVIRDVTASRKMDLEVKNQKKDLEIIAQVLKNSKKKFLEFIKSCQLYIRECRDILDNRGKSGENLPGILRNLHTMKGNANMMGFSYLANLLHLEEDAILKQGDSGNNLSINSTITASIGRIQREVLRHQEIFNRAFPTTEESKRDQIIYRNIKDIIRKASGKKGMQSLQESKLTIVKLNNLVDSLETEKLEDVLSTTFENLPKIAKNLDKMPPKIDLINGEMRLPMSLGFIIKDIIMHLTRNSIDHGIEKPHIRRELNKFPKGKITINVFYIDENQKEIGVEYFDDGGGLDLNSIQSKSRALGLIDEYDKNSDIEIANMIFNTGLTTSIRASLISGRGVGLDMVKHEIELRGGSIEIMFIDNEIKTRTLKRKFKFMIRLPVPSSRSVA